MRVDALDIGTMGRLLADLAAAHGKPFGAAAERQVKVYHEALADCSVDEVEAAVKTACREFERFPKPKALRMLVMSRRPPKRTTVHDDLDRCPGCGTGYQWRRLAHWVQGAYRLECDCSWRKIVRGYASDDDLTAMGSSDPFAADEMRRRAHIQRGVA